MGPTLQSSCSSLQKPRHASVTESDAKTDSDPDSHSDADSHPDSDSHSHSHSHSDSDAVTDSDPVSGADPGMRSPGLGQFTVVLGCRKAKP